MSIKATSTRLITDLTGQTAFTDVMGVKVFPFISINEKEVLPVTTFTVARNPFTKDGDTYDINLSFWFNMEQYDECVEFLDTMTDFFKENRAYKWLSSTPEFIEDSLCFTGNINIQKL